MQNDFFDSIGQTRRFDDAPRAIIITAIGTLIGALFVFAAFTLQAASFG
jgi:hypothetical protein